MRTENSARKALSDQLGGALRLANETCGINLQTPNMDCYPP